MGLPGPDILSNLTSFGEGLSPKEQAAALALLEKYDGLFLTGPHNLGLMKGNQHHLNLEDSRPFRAQPYQKSKAEEAQVALSSVSY